MPGATTVSIHDGFAGLSTQDDAELGLVIAWCADEPDRVGEVAFVPAGETLELGREHEGPGALAFRRQRPGEEIVCPPLAGPGISRRQLKIKHRAGALAIESVGRCAMLSAGEPTTRALLVPGETLLLKGQLLLLCVTRPRHLPPLRDYPIALASDFGRADGLGFVGESPALWELRDQLAFAAKAGTHVLVLGESGTGKELAAHAIHRLSSRKDGPFVSRNAATIPSGLVDAELFGNVKNYPNPGTPERAGLIGESSGGTLLLDEIGELDPALQSHLLRVLDRDGEYHRLGEARARHADLRLIGATNRDPSELKHDLLPRLAVRVELPPLSARLEDVPLIVRHLLDRAAQRAPEAALRFRDERGVFRVDPTLIEALLGHACPGNVRDLDALLWAAMSEARGAAIGTPRELLRGPAREPAPPARPGAPPRPERAAPPVQLGADDLLRAIRAHDGNLLRAAGELGLPSRYALYRLMKKLDVSLDAVRRGSPADEGSA